MCVWWGAGGVCMCPSQRAAFDVCRLRATAAVHYKTPTSRDAKLMWSPLNLSLPPCWLFWFHDKLLFSLTSLVTCLLGLSSKTSVNPLMICFFLAHFTLSHSHPEPPSTFLPSHSSFFLPSMHPTYSLPQVFISYGLVCSSLLPSCLLTLPYYTISQILTSFSCFWPTSFARSDQSTCFFPSHHGPPRNEPRLLPHPSPPLLPLPSFLLALLSQLFSKSISGSLRRCLQYNEIKEIN